MSRNKFKAARLVQFLLFIRVQMHTYLLGLLVEHKGELLKGLGLHQNVYFNPSQYSNSAEASIAWKAAELHAGFILGDFGFRDVSHYGSDCKHAIGDKIALILQDPAKQNERLLFTFMAMFDYLGVLSQHSLKQKRVHEILQANGEIDPYKDEKDATNLVLAILRDGGYQNKIQEFVQGAIAVVLIEAFLDFGIDSDQRLANHQFQLLQARFIKLVFEKVF